MSGAAWYLRFGVFLLVACACFFLVAWITGSAWLGLAVYAALGFVYLVVLDLRSFFKASSGGERD